LLWRCWLVYALLLASFHHPPHLLSSDNWELELVAMPQQQYVAALYQAVLTVLKLPSLLLMIYIHIRPHNHHPLLVANQESDVCCMLHGTFKMLIVTNIFMTVNAKEDRAGPRLALATECMTTGSHI
jgi:hypothetical protein